MSERITDLRRRMIEDMRVRNLSPTTQASYVHAVKKFSRHFGRSPADLGLDEVHAYQVHLVRGGIAWATLNQTVSALRFFYGVTLGRKDLPERIPYARVPKTLPVVLSSAEVARLIEAVEDPVCRTALATVYATGLRTAEVLSLRIEHIESARGLIRVEQGKGRKDRYVMLSATLLATLRAYWRIARPRRFVASTVSWRSTSSPASVERTSGRSRSVGRPMSRLTKCCPCASSERRPHSSAA